MLGAVPHAKVYSVLITGNIFLNSLLTEAICIAILEAASCGLLTVSTHVGVVPEVLPDDRVVLAKPDLSDMVHAITRAINMFPLIDPQAMHLRADRDIEVVPDVQLANFFPGDVSWDPAENNMI